MVFSNRRSRTKRIVSSSASNRLGPQSEALCGGGAILGILPRPDLPTVQALPQTSGFGWPFFRCYPIIQWAVHGRSPLIHLVSPPLGSWPSQAHLGEIIPNRKGYNGQSSISHAATSLAFPAEHSKHLRLIVLNGVILPILSSPDCRVDPTVGRLAEPENREAPIGAAPACAESRSTGAICISAHPAAPHTWRISLASGVWVKIRLHENHHICDTPTLVLPP